MTLDYENYGIFPCLIMGSAGNIASAYLILSGNVQPNPKPKHGGHHEVDPEFCVCWITGFVHI